MSDALQITPRLWQLKMGNVNAYLIKSGNELILVDAGWPKKADALFECVRKAGHNPIDIGHLVLTHGHIDHAGSGAEVQRRTGVKVYAHEADLDLIVNGHAEHPGTKVSSGIIPHLLNRIFIKPGGTVYESFKVDHLLSDGESLPMASEIQVIHTPGHAAGHICLLMKEDDVLIAGDICSNVLGLGYSILYEDLTLTKESILKVSKLQFNKAVFGHGNPIITNANQKLEKRFTL